jgi:SAM-dependent methyltransferase
LNELKILYLEKGATMSLLETSSSVSGHVSSRVDQEFEHLSWPYVIILPLMFLAALYIHVKKYLYGAFRRKPKTNLWCIDGISINARNIKDGAAGWRALDATYNHYKGEGKTLTSRVADYFWLHIRNAQAVRNRLLIAKHELYKAIDAVSREKGKQPVQILSLAAGTAQGVIETVAKMNVPVRVLLIDADASALNYARTLAQKYGVEASFETRQGDVVFFNRFLDGFEPDIIEMMGLTDYLRDKMAVALFKKIFRHLKSGGFFLTCHIHFNGEAYFLRQAVNWEMLYRSKEQFEDLLIDGGFFSPLLISEPFRIHSVAVSKKL